VSSYFLDSDIL